MKPDTIDICGKKYRLKDYLGEGSFAEANLYYNVSTRRQEVICFVLFCRMKDGLIGLDNVKHLPQAKFLGEEGIKRVYSMPYYRSLDIGYYDCPAETQAVELLNFFDKYSYMCECDDCDSRKEQSKGYEKSKAFVAFMRSKETNIDPNIIDAMDILLDKTRKALPKDKNDIWFDMGERNLSMSRNGKELILRDILMSYRAGEKLEDYW